MARCKCQICKKQLNTNEAYKVVDKNNKNKYYCSEVEFQAEEARKNKAKEDKDNVYKMIVKLFRYEVVNSQLFAEWNIWNKLRTNEEIYQLLQENEEYLQQICDRHFDTEYQRIRYFCTVVKNKLADFKPKPRVVEEVKPRVVVEEVMYEAPAKSLNKRRSLADLEGEDIW